MSFAHDRGLFGSALEGLGVLGCRPLGFGGPVVRLPGSLPGGSPSFQCVHSPSQLLPVFHQGLALSAALAELRAKGAIEPAPLSLGYYSHLFVTPKVTGGWRPVIDLSHLNRPVRVSFSHGDSTVGPPVSASWGLDGVSGSEGRIPSGSCSSGVSLLPEILCRRGGLSISRSLLRPFDCSARRSLESWPRFRRLCIVTGSGS